MYEHSKQRLIRIEKILFRDWKKYAFIFEINNDIVSIEQTYPKVILSRTGGLQRKIDLEILWGQHIVYRW